MTAREPHAAMTRRWIVQPDYSEKWPVTFSAGASLHRRKEGSR
jgi:hypothetical protein